MMTSRGTKRVRSLRLNPTIAVAPGNAHGGAGFSTPRRVWTRPRRGGNVCLPDRASTRRRTVSRTTDRRRFLRTGLAGAALLAAGRLLPAAEKEPMLKKAVKYGMIKIK